MNQLKKLSSRLSDCRVDKLTKYQEDVKTLLTNYASDDVSDEDVEVQLILDTERNHYQWMNVGWQGFNRIYRCVMHFDIKDGKIWLQQNLTDRNPAEELVMMGVPREDIVLGLQAPYKRQYTDYGVA
jgi:XisI protein